MNEFNPASLPHNPQPAADPARLTMRRLLIDTMSEALRGNKHVDSDAHRLSRQRLLAMKTHQVGRILLPLPNIVALQLIEALPTDNPLQFTLEGLYILRHQQNEDLLFLAGNERRKQMAASLRDVQAHEFPAYYLALLEMLDMIKKKTQSYSQTLTQQTDDLMQQLSASSSPKPTDNPPATGSSN